MIYFSELNSISEIFSLKWIIVSIFIAFLFGVSSIFVSRKFLGIIQQCGYRICDSWKWLKRNSNVYMKRIAMLSMLGIFGYVLLTVTFMFISGNITAYLGFIFFAFSLVLFIRADFKHKEKVPIMYTRRFSRLSLIAAFLSFLISLIVIFILNAIAFSFKQYELVLRLRLGVLCLMPLLTPIICVIAEFIVAPFEKLNNKKYIVACKQKLSEFENLKKIGITGSYGKTGVKEILNTMLCEKYKVLATPKSFNTPMGICKTVEKLDSTYDVFIAEMGARRMGEINELCDIVNPDYAVITGITEQHLETFGTIENIINTKFELAKAAKGEIIISADNEHTSKLLNTEYKNRVITAGLNDSNEVYAENISTSLDGSRFTLCLFGKKIEVATSLVGRHNVQNICVASALASKVGLSIEEIAFAISKLKTVEHRLEIKKAEDGTIIIDDSYNSNPIGIQAAIEVMNGIEGRKIVVTPGMVEMGSEEKRQNREFGAKLAKCCDKVILVGSIGSYDIRRGLLENGFDYNSIIAVKTLEDAKIKLVELKQANDVVLFENDLPDRFD